MRGIEATFLYGQQDATEIWLCRHGDCYLDMSADPDPPLSSWGREQAAKLAERANRIGVEAVYASQARRAIQTAEAIGRPVTNDGRLREFGNDARAAAEAAMDANSVNWSEDAAQAQKRIKTALDEIAARHPGQRVVVVSHGGIILAHLCDLMRVEFPQLRILPYYTSVTVIRHRDGKRRVGSINDTAHLEPITGPPTI
ncbi:MAG TPA: histidine phosphatase family protein [Candidatus Dormibacteraeota bacterium]